MTFFKVTDDPSEIELQAFETGVRELRRLLRIMDRTGQSYLPACRDVIRYVECEIRRRRQQRSREVEP